jgi:hypothetical protein
MRHLKCSSRPFSTSLARRVYERTRAHCFLAACPMLPFLAALCGMLPAHHLIDRVTGVLAQRRVVPRGTSSFTPPSNAAGGASDRGPWRESRFIDITILVTIGFAVYILAAWRLLP